LLTRGSVNGKSTFMTGGQAVSDSENKQRNREIAENEAERQTIGDIRVSVWAIAVAVIIGLAAVGWVLIHNN
jgi:hypothetical protein